MQIFYKKYKKSIFFPFHFKKKSYTLITNKLTK